MEDVLDVYCQPYDPSLPRICMDEMGKNLVKDKYVPEPAKPGQVAREDYTYEKEGRSNLFIVYEPLAGKRYLKVTEHRTKQDWALFVQEILDEQYPEARKVVLVMDNLNTHTPASFYEVFPPEQAKALADRLEIHYTPKHASWLNIAEIELSVLGALVLQRDFTNAVPAIGQAVAYGGSNRQHSRGVAGKQSKPRPQADPTRAGARRLARANAPEQR
jgi:hypothetical protein